MGGIVQFQSALHGNTVLKSPVSRPKEESLDPTDEVQRAFLTLLFNKYRGALFRHVRRLVNTQEDAADLVQDTYLRVMDRISVSRFGAEARAYLFQTATNLARDHYRRQRFRSHASIEEISEERFVACEQAPDQVIAASEVTAALRAAVQEMPDETRAVFVLARGRDLSYAEIARHLHLGKRTVERRMAEAMAFLVERLRGQS